MDRQKLMIKAPCSKDFDEMEGEGHRRFCDHCEKHVHNLSELTRAEALALLAENADAGICVVYTFDASNRVRFREEMGFARPPKAQLRGLKRLLAAAAFVPLLAGLPACDTLPEPEYAVVDGANSFRPIDAILEAEREFVSSLRDLLGFAPEYEYQLAGEIEVAPEVDPAQNDGVEPEPQADPSLPPLPDPEPMMLGRIAPADLLEPVPPTETNDDLAPFLANLPPHHHPDY